MAAGIVGTPVYMPPEMANGDLPRLLPVPVWFALAAFAIAAWPSAARQRPEPEPWAERATARPGPAPAGP
jgi:hypothetical protein